MTFASALLVAVSVLFITAGQLLFKLVAVQARDAGGITLKVLLIGGVAIAIYGLATVAWIAVLRTVPLTKAYPFMALSFVLVPLGGVIIFSEHVRPQYYGGVALIIVGVIMAALSARA